MEIKKILLALVIIISLNLPLSSSNFILRERESIVLVHEKREDDVTNDFLKENERQNFEKFISITFAVLLIDSGNVHFVNTS